MAVAIPTDPIEQYASDVDVMAMGRKAAQGRNGRCRLPRDIDNQDNRPPGFGGNIRRRAGSICGPIE